jgi:twitching motility protein PilI
MPRPERIDLRAFQQELSERLKHKTAAEVGNLRLALECGGRHWLVRLADTGEVLPVPPVTPVPMTKPWFLGIANVRGALHGVIDFAALLGGAGVARSAGAVGAGQARLVLLGPRFVDVRAGLMVERVLGLRNLADFTQAGDAAVADGEMSSDSGRTDESRRGGSDGGARHRWEHVKWTDATGSSWSELDLARLAADPEFMQVGA